MASLKKRKNKEPTKELVESSGYSRYETSWLTQFRYLMWRSWISLFRNTALFKVRVMRSAVIALFMGLVYLRLSVSQKGVQNINGAIFLLITNASFSSIFAVVNSFPLEMGIFLREYGSRLYRVDVYFLSKTFAEVPVFVLTSIIFTTVTYWMIGLYAGFETYVIAVGVLFLVTNVAMSLGYLVSTLCGSISLSLALVPPLLIPFMLFGGLFLNNNNIPAYFVWLEYLSWFKYSNEILLINQWQNIDHIPCDNSSIPLNTTLPPIPGQRCAYRNGDDVINYFSYDADNVTVDIVVLAVLVFGFRFLSFHALLVRAKRSKV